MFFLGLREWTTIPVTPNEAPLWCLLQLNTVATTAAAAFQASASPGHCTMSCNGLDWQRRSKKKAQFPCI